MYELLLMRISALRLFFHFGFLIISNCLLGIGASGTLIAYYQDAWRERQRFWISLFSILYIISLISTYVFLLRFHIPNQLNLSDFSDLLRFSIFNLAAIPPFFFAGTIIGMIITFNAERVNAIYFADLAGAGLGCLILPFLLSRFGAGGSFVFLCLLVVISAIVAFPARGKRAAIGAGILLLALGAALLPRLDKQFPVPGKDILDFTDKMRMEVPRYPDYTKWGSNSRIDLLPVNYNPLPFWCGKDGRGRLPNPPDTKIITQDGSAATFIMNFSDNPEALEIIRRSMYSTVFQVKERPRVFIIGVGGGNDVWAAKIHDASYIKGIELNKPTLEIHQKILPEYTRVLTQDPNITLVCSEGRSALMREPNEYDVIQLSGIDTWTALTSGSYVMAEDYLYTRQAIENMYAHLAENGILQIIRFAGPSESLRLISNINASFERTGVIGLDQSIACIKNNHLMCTLLKKGTFSDEEVGRLAAFAEENGFEPVYLPRRVLGTMAETFIRTPDKEGFIANCKPNISPTTDDSPYFFFFSRWPNPFRFDDYQWRPDTLFWVNPNFILLQLLLSSLLSALFILAPLLVFARKGIERTWMKQFLIFFAGLGLGFIAVEIVAMQKLALFLGHPIYSITVTLFSMLIFTGLGSLLSAKLFQPPDKKVWLVPAGLVALLVLFVVLSPQLVSSLIHLSLPARIVITAGVLAPICLLLGVPFAYGIRLVNLKNPSIIPWAWAVNGCCTVVGSILTVILSMSLGFNAVIVMAAFIYIAAFTALATVR